MLVLTLVKGGIMSEAKTKKPMQFGTYTVVKCINDYGVSFMLLPGDDKRKIGLKIKPFIGKTVNLFIQVKKP